jgi:hypothetical protein
MSIQQQVMISSKNVSAVGPQLGKTSHASAGIARFGFKLKSIEFPCKIIAANLTG